MLKELKAPQLVWSNVEHRTHPIFVEAVEHFNQRPIMVHPLTVVDVPDDVEWAIQEHLDGGEWIVERHRTWGFVDKERDPHQWEHISDPLECTGRTISSIEECHAGLVLLFDDNSYFPITFDEYHGSIDHFELSIPEKQKLNIMVVRDKDGFPI